MKNFITSYIASKKNDIETIKKWKIYEIDHHTNEKSLVSEHSSFKNAQKGYEYAKSCVSIYRESLSFVIVKDNDDGKWDVRAVMSTDSNPSSLISAYHSRYNQW